MTWRNRRESSTRLQPREQGLQTGGGGVQTDHDPTGGTGRVWERHCRGESGWIFLLLEDDISFPAGGTEGQAAWRGHNPMDSLTAWGWDSRRHVSLKNEGH